MLFLKYQIKVMKGTWLKAESLSLTVKFNKKKEFTVYILHCVKSAALLYHHPYSN